MNEALLDVNLLIASVVENHADHERAQRFVETLQTFNTTPTTQGGFLRFRSSLERRAKAEQPPRMSIAAAFAALRAVTDLSTILFYRMTRSFTRVSLRSLSGHRQWTDAYLLSLARKYGMRLATLERKMENMDDLSPRLLSLSFLKAVRCLRSNNVSNFCTLRAVWLNGVSAYRCLGVLIMATEGKRGWGKWVAALLLFGAAATAGVWYYQNKGQDGPDNQMAAVTRGDLMQVVTATGQLAPVVNVQVGSQISGSSGRSMSIIIRSSGQMK